jgi:glycosyltransferase involved in cell wall biosynthesis
MRVLHAIPGLVESSGGPTTALVGLATAQAQAGEQVTILTTLREGQKVAATAELAAAGVHVVSVERCRGPLLRHPRLAETVASLVADHDVVHAHGVWEEVQYQASRACGRSGVPFVIRCCGLLDEWSLSRKWLRKAVYRAWRLDRMLEGATAVHCSTAAEAASTGRLGFAAPIVVEPNGVRLEEFVELPQRGAFRESIGRPSAPLILFLGRIHPGKGVEYLIPALLHVTTPGATLVIVGGDSGGYRNEMERMVAAHRLNDRVIFTGALSGRQKLEALVDADVFCLPSEHENFGISVIEAMAAGCPVVVSEHVGLKEEIGKYGAGSVTPLDSVAIARAIDAWLQEPAARHEAGAKARASALRDFDWNVIAARWQRRYSQVLGRAHA